MASSIVIFVGAPAAVAGGTAGAVTGGSGGIFCFCATTQAGQASNARSLSYYPDDVNAAGNVQTVGGQLFTTFLLPFEITSLLLFVAAIGAVYLTRHHVTGSRRT